MAIPLLQEKFSNSGEGDSKLDHHPEQNEPATNEDDGKFATYLLAFLLVSPSTPVVYLDMQRQRGERKALKKTTPVLIFEKTG